MHTHRDATKRKYLNLDLNNIRPILKSLASTSTSALKTKHMCSLEKKKKIAKCSDPFPGFVLADLPAPFTTGPPVLGGSAAWLRPLPLVSILFL